MGRHPRSPTDGRGFPDGHEPRDHRRCICEVAQGDVPAALGAFADDIQWTEPDGHPLAGTYVGHQAVIDGVFMRLGEIGDDFAVVPEQFVADRDTVVALGHLSWRHKSTGEPASVRMAHVWTFERGKATTFEQLIDTVKVRELSG